MPTSVYFDTGTIPEQRLYEDLIIEQLRAFGQEVFYLPRTLVNEDTILGEDPLSEFNDAYLIEMYVENIEGYDGEKELMTKFGLDIQNEVTFVVARRRWEQLSSIDQNLIASKFDIAEYKSIKKNSKWRNKIFYDLYEKIITGKKKFLIKDFKPFH